MADATMTVAATGAHGLLSALQARGVRYLFGVPGHGAYPIYNALCDVPAITPIIGRHEQSSFFTALTYAWAGGGVAVATSVPEAGLTNAATGLLEATLSQDRVLFLLEENPMHRDVLRSVSRHYHRVDAPEDVPAAVHALLDQLEHGRPGAATLELPNRVLTARDVPVRISPDPLPLPVRPVAAIAEAARVLSAADRVAIVAASAAAVSGVEANLRTLAEALDAPVFVDGGAKGLLPDDHPLALGRSWSPTGPGERILQDADVILVIGAPLGGGQAGGQWDPRMVAGGRSAERLAQQLILVDWDGQDHGALPARCRLHGHIGSIVAALADAVEPTGRRAGYPTEHLDAARDWLWEYAEGRVPWAAPFFHQLDETLPSDAIVLLDSLVGLWLDRLLTAHLPRSIRFPFGTGTLGYGVPAAVGARLACPDREVVVVAGDGAFLYNPQ
ncbi:MAG: thiamine pyrophosphate-binding protein, partial [Chloroflexi bacterium]|nr:thiamine pyrophosphate-binding protein [Chloroflexota bacterium]